MEEKNSFLKIIIILLVLLLVATLVVGFIYINKKSNKGVEKEVVKEEITFPLEEFVVNLKEENGLPGYLKIKIALMYYNKKEEKALENNIEKIRDVINGQLRKKTSSEILNEEEIQNIKSEMKDSINEALDKDLIEGIYFTDIVVQ